MLKVQKIGDVTRDHGIKAILHGPAGSGKTYSISTIPDHKSVIVLSAEAGLLSIRAVAKDIDVVVINKVDDLRNAYKELSGPAGDLYKTIVLDSLTEIAQQILSDERGTTAQSGKANDPRKAYGEMAERMTQLVKGFRDIAGKNVILLCQQERVQDDSGRILYGPSMPGKKVGQSLPYVVDLVGAVRSKRDPDGTVHRAFQFGFDEQYEAKDRSGVLDDFEQPDWSIIFDKINKGGGNG